MIYALYLTNNEFILHKTDQSKAKCDSKLPPHLAHWQWNSSGSGTLVVGLPEGQTLVQYLLLDNVSCKIAHQKSSSLKIALGASRALDYFSTKSGTKDYQGKFKISISRQHHLRNMLIQICFILILFHAFHFSQFVKNPSYFSFFCE